MYDNLDSILSQDSLASLKQQLKGKGVIPFVGAGMSVGFGYPGWGVFLESVAHVEVKSKVTEMLRNGEYEEAAELIDRQDPSFRERVKNSFGTEPVSTSETCAVELLPLIFPSCPIFTTNYDRVLEDVYEKTGRSLKSSARTMREILEMREAVLTKLHGDFSNDQMRILTLSEYKKHYGDDAPGKPRSDLPLPSILAQLFCTESVLFLGCSLINDRYLRLMKRVKSLTTHFAVVASPIDKLRSRQFKYLNIRPIEYSPIDRHKFLPDILEFLASSALLPPRPVTLTIDARPNEDLLSAIVSHLRVPRIGVPRLENTQFLEATSFITSKGEPPSLRVFLEGKRRVLRAEPSLRIPGTQTEVSWIDLEGPTGGPRGFSYLMGLRVPINLRVEDASAPSIVISDDSAKLTVRIMLT